MPPKHRLKCRRTEHSVPHQRTVELVDARTLTAHLLTDAAITAGRLANGRYIALCGQDVIPACPVEAGQSRCASCVSIPTQSEAVMTCWYVQSLNAQDTHRGYLRRGRALAACGEFSLLRSSQSGASLAPSAKEAVAQLFMANRPILSRSARSFVAPACLVTCPVKRSQLSKPQPARVDRLERRD